MNTYFRQRKNVKPGEPEFEHVPWWLDMWLQTRDFFKVILTWIRKEK